MMYQSTASVMQPPPTHLVFDGVIELLSQFAIWQRILGPVALAEQIVFSAVFSCRQFIFWRVYILFFGEFF